MISSRPISKNYPVGTPLAMMKGPIKGRNWYDLVNNINYSVTQIGDGAVALQGTNDIALRAVRPDEPNPVERGFLPTETATWTDILASTSTAGTTTGNFATQYQFLRLVVTSQGTTGIVTQAWVQWN